MTQVVVSKEQYTKISW